MNLANSHHTYVLEVSTLWLLFLYDVLCVLVSLQDDTVVSAISESKLITEVCSYWYLVSMNV